MGLLQPYQGTYVNAESASGYLDAEGIIAGCDAVDAEASRIGESANAVSSATSGLDKFTLSVNDQTVQGDVDECCTGITNTETNIMNMTSQIREMAETQYNQIQERLNNEAYNKDVYEYNRRNSG